MQLALSRNMFLNHDYGLLLALCYQMFSVYHGCTALIINTVEGYL